MGNPWEYTRKDAGIAFGFSTPVGTDDGYIRGSLVKVPIMGPTRARIHTMFFTLRGIGRPCDAQGQFLPPDTPPPLRATTPSEPWDPFESRLEFEVAEFLYKTEQMSGKNISKLMELWAADVARYGGQPPFADHADLYTTIDAILLGDVAWRCLKGQYQGPRPAGIVPAWMDEEYDVWFQDSRELVLRMLANADFKDEFDVAPIREYTHAGNRRYHNFMSGDWAWREADLIAAQVPDVDGAMLVPIILGSDKTTVSVATGQNDYYPLYMSIGNMHNNVRRAHRDSVVLVAFLAIPKAERKDADSSVFRKFHRQLLHTSLSAIFEPLRPGMTVPEVVRCPDAHFRKAIWSFAAYIADYMEQVVVSCIVQGWCPTCLQDAKALDKPGLVNNRTRVLTEAYIKTFDPAVLWDDYGIIHDLVPFTNDFPRADINEMLSGDLLHQLIKGTFKDHLVTWIGEYLMKEHGDSRGKELLDEIDCRLALVPPFPGLRHFKQGRNFKQWTGDDSKGLMKIYLSAIYGVVPNEMVRTVAAFLQCCYIARRDTVDDLDIAQFRDARSQFYDHRKVFQETGVRPDGFSLPRQHSLDHYDQHMINFGAPNGLCTSITEAKHIKAVKEPWRRSNRFEPLGQMLLTNQRLDKLSAARADFTARGMLSGTCLGAVLAALQAEAEERRSPATDDNQPSTQDNNGIGDNDYYQDDPYTDPPEPEEEEEDGDNNASAHEDSGVVHGPRVSGFVVLPRKHQRGYPRTLQDLGPHIGIQNLTTLVSRFLFPQMHPDVPLPEDDTLLPPLPGLMQVRVYHSAIATFYAPSDPSGIGGMHREYIRATPSWRKGPPRYDCVFVGKDTSLDGFRGLHAARIRAFFSILWFSAVGDEPDEVTGLWKVEPDYFEDGERMRDVIHVESLLRSAHLIPFFGEDPVPL
ncbi:hypothetical protein L226DRAFT_547722 [Lentinus tigrinus ALCF2SS1-7]|uniref:uncharacterized protein n=1 Tax=Lentinus tigrinus ALCF2SS1-7 TaxID=1328758 RepID=UPI0011660549|nr:hypothetical protein L226DRAFT_547722 [Lentinus tigrinus ALCF2SS1-7]